MYRTTVYHWRKLGIIINNKNHLNRLSDWYNWFWYLVYSERITINTLFCTYWNGYSNSLHNLSNTACDLINDTVVIDMPDLCNIGLGTNYTIINITVFFSLLFFRLYTLILRLPQVSRRPPPRRLLNPVQLNTHQLNMK